MRWRNMTGCRCSYCEMKNTNARRERIRQRIAEVEAMDPDPWMDEPFTDEEMAAIEAAIAHHTGSGER